MSLRIPGSDFDIANIYCIGRNYSEHIKELANAVPESPVIFLKPTASLALPGSPIELPAGLTNVQHEVEVVIAIGRHADSVDEASALECVEGYAIGIDVTARDLQESLKKKGLPWVKAKGLKSFAPVSPIVKAKPPFSFELRVNGAPRQKGDTGQMLFSIARILSYLSNLFTLMPGDIVFTGTPSGVGPLVPGDRLEATLAGNAGALTQLDVEVVSRVAHL